MADRPPAYGSKRQVGFFAHCNLGEKHLGGILVTNHIGVPVEFKYTEPVVATRLHRILYGSVLERYLRETVIRERLGREVRSEAEFFIAPTDEREYLGTLAGREMMALDRAQVVSGESSAPFTRVREREALVALEDGVT